MQTFNEAKKQRNATEVLRDATAPFVTQSMAKKANPTLSGSGTASGAAVPAAKNGQGAGASRAAVPSVPGARVYNNAPAMLGNYAFDTDFMAEMQKAEAAGDYAKAKEFEYWRNQKLGYMDSPYQTTDKYNYNNPYAGQLERMQDDIINREAFSYDYRDDEQYQALRNLKEKEADKAYADGYGQLSTQFDGDIPVNMINKLLTTKSEIVDQADSYIPQLRQMAYDMYMNEGNAMRQNYAMMQDAAAQDYNRWLDNRDFAVAGMENAYDRAWNEKTYADDIAYRDKVFDRGVLESDRGYDQTERWNQADWDKWNTQLYEDRSRYNDDQAWKQKEWERSILENDRAYKEGVRQFDEDLAFRKWAAMM